MVVLSPLVPSPALANEEPTPCHAIVPRQLSVWPFGKRDMRLLLLLDPSRVETEIIAPLLRAMQHTCFRSQTGSQTTAVRAAVLAAHYVLQHHNHDDLAYAQLTAGVAVAIRRGGVAYVALAGEAAALAWRSGRLSGQRTANRSGRPLGLDAEPRITLWSTPLRAGDRLILATGAAWREETPRSIADILAAHPTCEAEELLVEVLSSAPGRARVLIDDGTLPARGSAVRPGRMTAHTPHVQPKQAKRKRWRTLLPLLPAAALGVGAAIILSPATPPQHEALRQQAESILTQAREATDLYQAHALVAVGRSLAQRAADLAPNENATLLQRATAMLDDVDRVQPVQPTQVVRLGPTGANVVDLAVSAERLFTLDVVEGAVRGFDPLAAEQWPTPDTLLVRKGAALGGRSLDTPVAIQYVASGQPESGALTIIDRARTIAQLRPDGVLSARSLPSSGSWQRLGALGADADGNLYVLDSGAQALLEYPGASQRLVDPPSPLLATRSFGLERVAEVLPLRELYVRLDDGSVRRLTREGQSLDFAVRPPDGSLGPLAALAPDREGGLFLADPAHARILQVTAEGAFVRQLRDPALAGIRQLQSSPDGRRLFGLVASGVLAFDLPAQ